MCSACYMYDDPDFVLALSDEWEMMESLVKMDIQAADPVDGGSDELDDFAENEAIRQLRASRRPRRMRADRLEYR